jgi:hypothetical protein
VPCPRGARRPSSRQDDPARFEVGEHQDVEQLGAGSGTESVEALTELSLDVLQVHVDWTLAPGCISSSLAKGVRIGAIVGGSRRSRPEKCPRSCQEQHQPPQPKLTLTPLSSAAV